MKKKPYFHLGFDKFVKEYVAPDKMPYDITLEQIGKKTEFQRVMRTYEIKGHITEKNQSNQNAVEQCIQDLQQRWYSTMFRKY